MVTTEGLNNFLDTYIGDLSKVNTWYVGLVSVTSFTGFAITDTMASHAGWTEYTDYSETTRPILALGDPSAGVMNNPITIDFTPNNDVSVVGYFITSVATKGAATGYLPIQGYFAEGTSAFKAGNLSKFTFTITARSQ